MRTEAVRRQCSIRRWYPPKTRNRAAQGHIAKEEEETGDSVRGRQGGRGGFRKLWEAVANLATVAVETRKRAAQGHLFRQLERRKKEEVAGGEAG